MKRIVALIVGVAFAAGFAGSALAQTAPAAPPKTDAAPKTEMAPKTETKPDAKKPAAALNASGTVKTAAADSLVVTGKAKGKDAEWTFAVDPKTKIRKNNKDVTAADLAAGDSVQVRYHADGGKNVAEAVTVRAATKKAAEAPKAEAPKAAEAPKK